MARVKIVRCVENHPFLRETSAGLVQGIQPGRLVSLTVGKSYEVLSVERGWYRILDDTGEDYLFPPDLFEDVK